MILRTLLLSILFFLCGCSTPPSEAQQSSSSDAGVTFSKPTPKDPRTRAKTHTELGSLYFQDGNLIVALEELTFATSIDPDYAPAFNIRGLVLYYVKEFDSAEEDFLRALSLEENNPEINNNYGWFLCQIGREKEAIRYLERAYRNTLYQTPVSAYLNMGACLIKLDRLDQAEDILRKSLHLKHDDPQALFHLGHIYYLRGNMDAARRQLLEAGKQMEPGPEMLWLLLRIERKLGHREEERSLASQLRRRFPTSAEYQELLKGKFE